MPSENPDQSLEGRIRRLQEQVSQETPKKAEPPKSVLEDLPYVSPRIWQEREEDRHSAYRAPKKDKSLKKMIAGIIVTSTIVALISAFVLSLKPNKIYPKKRANEAKAQSYLMDSYVTRGNLVEAYIQAEKVMASAQGIPELSEFHTNAARLAYEWPMMGKDPVHSHYVHADTNGSRLKSLFGNKISNSRLQSPIFHNNTVYVGSEDGFMYSLDGTEGRELWKFKAQEPIEITAAIVDDLVVFGSLDDCVYALDKINGQLKWKFKTGGDLYGSPTVIDQKILIPSHDGKLYALGANGNQIWAFDAGEKIESSPAVLKNSVFLKAVSGLYRVDINNGSGRKIMDCRAFRSHSPAIPSPLVLCAGGLGPFALNYSSSKVEWQNAWSLDMIPKFTYYPCSNSFAFSDNEVFYSGSSQPDALLFRKKGGIYSIRQSDGELIWKYSIDYQDSEKHPAYATPLVTRDNVIVALPRGELLILSRTKGKKIASLSLPGEVTSQEPCFGNGRVYITTTNGYLCAFGRGSN